MMQNIYCSIVLDTRRTKKNGMFPVKLRVFSNEPRKQMLYTLPYEYPQTKATKGKTIKEATKEEFDSIWSKGNKNKTKNDNIKYLKRELDALLDKANDLLKRIKPFNFDEFERKMKLKTGETENIFHHYSLLIEKHTERKQYNTVVFYESSEKSIRNFWEHKFKYEPKRILFSEVTPKLLEQYESYMVETLEKSKTTVSMYLRGLRAVYNNAIQNNDINADVYPFGKRKYQIPAVRNVKKALDKEQLRILLNAKATTPEQEKARDFWFFSYACNGLNIKDIAQLRYSNLDNDKLTFYRSKTIHTAKGNLKPTIVFLTDIAKAIIDKYGCNSNNKKDFIFSIVQDTDNPEEQNRKINNFTRFINQNIKKLAKDNGISNDISTYWARHSFATIAIRSGASIEFVRQALDHQNTKTTQIYVSGLGDETIKEMMNKIMDF